MGRKFPRDSSDENGELFSDVCADNNLLIGRTFFGHKMIHKATWTSPESLTSPLEGSGDHYWMLDATERPTLPQTTSYWLQGGGSRLPRTDPQTSEDKHASTYWKSRKNTQPTFRSTLQNIPSALEHGTWGDRGHLERRQRSPHNHSQRRTRHTRLPL